MGDTAVYWWSGQWSVVYLVDIVTDWVTPPVQCFAVCEARHQGQSLQEHPTLRLLLPAVGRVDTVSPGLALSTLLGYYLIFFISESCEKFQ